MDASGAFRGKKITLMGLGLLGRGVGDARYLASCGAELIVTDLKSADALKPSLDALSGLPITYRLGGHAVADFRDRDLILKAPKTPLSSPYIAEARRQGIHVTMSTALFAKYAKEAGATLVGVTGTRGKTTTTEMIAHILRAEGTQVLVGGNIRGISTLALLPEVTSDTIVVLELDSWQLQGFRAEKLSPDVAVFTNLMPDHQDYYPDMDAYLADKAEIFLHQTAAGTLILGAQVVPHISERYAPKGKRIIAEPTSPMNLSIPGEHNRANGGCALQAVIALGVDQHRAEELLITFPGVPGRLECIREKDGVRFYNDTASTTPEATLAALTALTEPIVLIMGGSDKGLPLDELVAATTERATRIFLLPGTGTERIRARLPHASLCASMEDAVAEAVRSAVPGDAVLLSPAFASFGLFANEYERGDAFVHAVRKL